MTTSNLSFSPDWVSPPGSTLNDLIELEGKSLSQFANSMQLGFYELNKIIKGKVSIDLDLASKLEEHTGTSAKFWLEREKNYRNSIKKMESKKTLEKNWLSALPTADMAKFGWIKTSRNLSEKLTACLRYFDVSSVDEWQSKYNSLLIETAFRTSQAYDSTYEAISSWLRQGEIEASKIPCQEWCKSKLVNSIPEIRSLTTIENPNDFLPELKRILSFCGVALATARAPQGCRASGATFWPQDNKPILIMSFRYLSDDHFWFTLFHEIGHLVLHSDHRLILETNETKYLDIEKEADNYSENVLIPKEHQDELKTLRANDLRKIVKFSKKLGISKGIVVGQLQHRGILKKNYLNKLKVRYSW
ncbi:ImmA/IrrE family metallo-endopeptidase [uncultured Gilvimarinus sp.]|uniref:ImmA/IrrE family metallo-endopeptidase n=1 Tax=uncultured Gilvimarinus sp. TaxID=1689143 RepID=UPI0030DA0499